MLTFICLKIKCGEIILISIIVPVLNEEKSIEELLIDLHNLPGNKEIIVVDGGSVDNTITIAEKYGKVIVSEKGRSNQMNCGALNSKGDILWFVHSDSKVHIDSIRAMEDAINHGYIGGGFSMYFYDYKSLFLKYIYLTSNMRAKCLKLYFGDQGIFVKRNIFQDMNGFKAMPIMEDWDFSTRVKKLGKLILLKNSIGTSARRFKKGGPLKTHLLMHKIKFLYILGKDPEELAKLYRNIR